MNQEDKIVKIIIFLTIRNQ